MMKRANLNIHCITLIIQSYSLINYIYTVFYYNIHTVGLIQLQAESDCKSG